MKNSILTVHPELADEWSDKNECSPDEVSYGSNLVIWWTGSCRHTWQATAKSRSIGGGCPYCNGKKVLKGFNDVASRYPELVKEWSDKNSERPDEVSTGSHKKIIWIGSCGHEWEAVVKNRTAGAGCPYCAKVKVLKGFNDLQTLAPDIASEWSYKNPKSADQVLPNSNQKVWWKCNKGHEWRTTPAIRMTGSKCPYCSNIKLMKGLNDLCTTNSELAAEWSDRNLPVKASAVKNTSRKRYWWKCNKCGYEWQKSPFSRANDSSCPVCNGYIVCKGINDLETIAPKVACEWHTYKNGDLTPDQVSTDSARFVWWKGTCNHEWRARIVDRVYGHEPCKICQRGYLKDMEKAAAEYYLNRAGVQFINDDISEVGIPLDIYLPDNRVAVIFKSRENKSFFEERKEMVKKELCRKAKIRLVYILDVNVLPDEEVICISKTDDSNAAKEEALLGLFQLIGFNEDVDIDFIRDEDDIYKEYLENCK